MIYVGIDVAKDKHDCCIFDSDSNNFIERITIANNADGFNTLLETALKAAGGDIDSIRVGLENTGHYHITIFDFLVQHGLNVVSFNPMLTGQCRKRASIRKTKTDKLDAETIAYMLIEDYPHSNALYHNSELKSLTRYRFKLISQCSAQKVSLSRLVHIVFPELAGFVSTVNCVSVYALFSKYPSAKKIASARLNTIVKLLCDASKGRIKAETAQNIYNAAKRSVGITNTALELEIRHTIRYIKTIEDDVAEIDEELNNYLEDADEPLLTLPGIGTVTAAMILAEVGDFNRFSNPDQLLAYAGCSPTTYQSGKMYSNHAKMEKRGSRYLRYALFCVAKAVVRYEPTFMKYYDKKRSEGKHYYVVISHVMKKLVRVIYHLQTTGETYKTQEILS